MSAWLLVVILYVEEKGRFDSPIMIEKVAVYENEKNCTAAAKVLNSSITPRANNICLPIEDIKLVLPNN